MFRPETSWLLVPLPILEKNQSNHGVQKKGSNRGAKWRGMKRQTILILSVAKMRTLLNCLHNFGVTNFQTDLNTGSCIRLLNFECFRFWVMSRACHFQDFERLCTEGKHHFSRSLHDWTFGILDDGCRYLDLVWFRSCSLFFQFRGNHDHSNRFLVNPWIFMVEHLLSWNWWYFNFGYNSISVMFLAVFFQCHDACCKATRLNLEGKIALWLHLLGKEWK